VFFFAPEKDRDGFGSGPATRTFRHSPRRQI